MKIKNLNLLIILFALIMTSCSKDDEIFEENTAETVNEREETAENSELEVEEFIYSGMNDIYLYKADVKELADGYFANDIEREVYLEGFSTPEKLFDAFKSSEDRFSFITDDYHELEESFRGITSSTAGMQFGLGRISGSSYIFGFLQYIIPGTSAEEAGLERGTIFTEVNGQKLTLNNFQDLMQGTFSINIGNIENNSINLTDQTVSLTHNTYTSNPVHLVKTLNIAGKKVGYLMYNSFVADFDRELNDAFARFKSEGVTDLVLDLRYNGGGSVESAVDLASMITGQFEGEIFMKEQWNKKYQTHFETNNSERLLNRFNGKIRTGEAINSLNLSKVYVLTTGSSASASELVINGLEPYIDVVQIGENTTGKFQASVTLYDSPDFGRDGASQNHTYAIQPLVFKSANAAGRSDYVDGLAPDVKYTERVSELGTLGDPSEPLLQAALDHIQGKAPIAQKRADDNILKVGESGMHSINYQKMYLDEVPDVLKRTID